MEIEWVNHASFLAHEGDTTLLCDPWIDGRVFDESWALLAPTVFSYRDFRRITHIWFSHEHPDHFFPPNLRNIPSEFRQKITVFYQATRDKRVVSSCRQLGFKSVIELPSQWHVISDNMRIFCHSLSHGKGGDSWLAIRTPTHSLVNLNDCECSTEELRFVKHVAGEVDVLVTQFSYACWWGNPEDDRTWLSEATNALRRVVNEVSALAPKYVIPAASFVYFCHEENSYMNDHMNRVDAAFRTILQTGRQPVILYPGDYWRVGVQVDNNFALSKYSRDYQRVLAEPVCVRSVMANLEELKDAARNFARSIRDKNSWLLLMAIPSCTIDLEDHAISLKLGQGGLKRIARRRIDRHDITVRSGTLLHCLRVPWGGETLYINGRFRAPAHGNIHRFFRWTGIAQANDKNVYYDSRYVWRRLIQKIAARTA